ncbi:DNA gyrase subunit A [Weissella viridescens]|nr:DNA gyrase subunit A [Weissella viridescens]
MIRFSVDAVSETGRATQGVRLIRLDGDSKVATFTTVDPDPDADAAVDEEIETVVVDVVDEPAEAVNSQTEQVEALLDRAEDDSE